MTGFGQARRVLEGSGASVSVEVRSVNARFREIKIRQPFSLALESAVRKAVEARVGRGRVDVVVSAECTVADDALSPFGTTAAALAAAAAAAGQAQAQATSKNLALVAPSSVELLRFAQIAAARLPDERRVAAAVEAAVANALDALSDMRLREGQALEAALAGLAQDLQLIVEGLRPLLEQEELRVAARVRGRIEELGRSLGAAELDPDRVAAEVAMVLARGDLTEEQVRVDAHLARFRQVLEQTPTSGQGKTLDFLCQELFREITTMGSKITSHEGSGLVIEARAVVERMREQVQNVE